jgi:uncharacterized membrane protein HdeD (DUF308 family)
MTAGRLRRLSARLHPARAGGRRYRSSGWLFLCGLLMIASGVLAAVIEPEGPSAVASLVAWLLLASGAAELAAGVIGRHPERGVDMVLGFLSLAASAELILLPPGSGLSFTALVTTWLLARASAELLAALPAFLRDEELAAARLARAGIDLLLGLLCLILSVTTGLVETLFGWPAISVRSVMLAAGASLIVAGSVHVALAAGSDRRPGK